MRTVRITFWFLLLLWICMRIPESITSGQTTSSKATQPPPQPLRQLTGDDARRAEELDQAVADALSADRWDEAIVKLQEVLTLRTRVNGPKHHETVDAEWFLKALRTVAPMPEADRVAYRSAVALSKQAQSLYDQAKYADAQALSEKVLESFRRLLTDQHPQTAGAYNTVAEALKGQAKYAAAQPLYEKALEIQRRLLTEDHPDTAITYSYLGMILNAQAKYARAQPLLEKALSIFRRLLTDDHAYTATGYSNLAGNLGAQGKYGQAQPLLEKALEIRRRLLTDDSPQTANSYNNLALNLDNQGKFALAQPMFERALEIHRRRLTDNHPHTANTYNNLAYNLNAQGKYAQAQPLYEKSLEIYRRLLTDEHPHTGRSYNNLAVNLTAQGKYTQAQALLEKALDIERRLLTDDHPDTARCYISLAANLRAQRKFAQAQPLLEKALEIEHRLLTDDNPETAVSYNSLALCLYDQGNYTLAQPLFEKALEIRRRRLSDDHTLTSTSYNNLALNLDMQGKYAEAQSHFEKALEINRRLLTDEHPSTSVNYSNIGVSLSAQGKYDEARDQWRRGVRSMDTIRLGFAFTGLERAGGVGTMRLSLAAVLARLGQPAEAWQALEEDLGRGLLDDLAARQDRRLTSGERARLRELTTELERLDKLVETTPRGLEQAERAKRFEELKRERELASIAVGEFQTKLVQAYGPLAGQVAVLKEIQAALPADAALVAWVDIPPLGPSAADPDGEHWGVVVRSQGVPAWLPIKGTGPDGLWTKDDNILASQARTELRRRPAPGAVGPRLLVERLRAQRLDPLTKALGASAAGQPPARRLIVLPSRAMAGIPLEALLAPDDLRTVNYAPSGTVLKYLRDQPRAPRHAGLLALGDPLYDRSDKASEQKSLPDHGLLISVVTPGSNAATHGLRPGDVLLAYNGRALVKKEDLKAVAEGDKPIGVDVWRDGQVSRRRVAAGKLGVVLDSRPAPEAIAAKRAINNVLVALRSGGEDFAPLPGTRYEVEALAKLFQFDDRPTRILLGTDASEQELDRLATSNELSQFGFIHLATHGVIDEAMPERSAVILTQTDLPDPLEQVLQSQAGLSTAGFLVREIQRGWELKAELVTLSACETALGREAGGEGFVGFTQALLMSGSRTVCLSLWKVDDTATALLMQRFYANLLGRRPGLTGPMPKAEALREAKAWLRGLLRSEVLVLSAEQSGGVERGKGTKARQLGEIAAAIPAGGDNDRPYEPPHFWAAFVLAGDPD